MGPAGRSKTTHTETKMKIDLHSKPDSRGRLIIPVSEFSFAAYPIVINHDFRCLSDAASSPSQSRSLRGNMLGRHIAKLLRWMSGKPAAAPAASSLSRNLSLEQAVP
jgi:hypothetical protein